MASIIKILVNVINKATAPLKKIEKDMANITKKSKGMRGGIMGIGFAMLFMGMAFKRFIGGFLRGAFDAFKIVGTEQSIFTQKTNELSAAWGFFKFSLIDALSNSFLFVRFIDFLIQIITFVSKRPKLTLFIAISLIILFAVAAVTSLIGQFVLLGASLIALGVPLGTIAITLAVIMGITLVIIGAATLLVLIWTSDMSTARKVMLSIVTVLGAILVIVLLIVGTAALPWVLMGLGILAVIALIIVFKDTLITGLKIVGQWVKLIAIDIQYYFGEAINFLIGKINYFISLLPERIKTRFGLEGGIPEIDTQAIAVRANLVGNEIRRLGALQAQQRSDEWDALIGKLDEVKETTILTNEKLTEQTEVDLKGVDIQEQSNRNLEDLNNQQTDLNSKLQDLGYNATVV